MEGKDIKLWDRIQRGMEAGFDAAMSAVYNMLYRNIFVTTVISDGF